MALKFSNFKLHPDSFRVCVANVNSLNLIERERLMSIKLIGGPVGPAIEL